VRFSYRTFKATEEGNQPFVELAPGVRAPNHDLMKALNFVGTHLRLKIRIISGWRGNHEQWVLYMRFLRGEGNKAAPCCYQHQGYQHTWAQCGKHSLSNHADGKAADCGVILPNGEYVSIGNYKGARALLKKAGACLPVDGEAWHAEMGNNWGNN
jgi:hypothetical protein